MHRRSFLAGLFGAMRMLHMSHQLEDLLDALRLSRVRLSPALLDLLFEAVEIYQQLISEIAVVVRHIESYGEMLERIAEIMLVAYIPEAPAHGDQIYG